MQTGGGAMTKSEFTNLLTALGGLGGTVAHFNFGRNRYGVVLYPDNRSGPRDALVGTIRVKGFLSSIIIHRFEKSGDRYSVQYMRHVFVEAKYKKWLDEWRKKNSLKEELKNETPDRA